MADGYDAFEVSMRRKLLREIGVMKAVGGDEGVPTYDVAVRDEATGERLGAALMTNCFEGKRFFAVLDMLFQQQQQWANDTAAVSSLRAAEAPGRVSERAKTPGRSSQSRGSGSSAAGSKPTRERRPAGAPEAAREASPPAHPGQTTPVAPQPGASFPPARRRATSLKTRASVSASADHDEVAARGLSRSVGAMPCVRVARATTSTALPWHRVLRSSAGDG